MAHFILKDINIVNENKIETKDILIRNERIEKIDDNISSKENHVEIDGSGKYLIPGMIDDQVHFREPGLTHKGDIRTESHAALAGGITSYMEMPNCKPATLTHEALEDKFKLAGQKSSANFSFYMGTSNDNFDAVASLDPGQACGVKIFMGASTGNMLVDNPKTLEKFFANSPMLIATHCEDTPMILANEKKWADKYGEDIPFSEHPLIRSEEACYKSSSLAVDLAKKNNTKLHVLHITTAKELELFSDADLSEKHITAEACAHHLFFSADDYEEKGSLIKCNPSVKFENDRSKILAAVKSGKIDIIATDHAPHSSEEKGQKYQKAPSGLPLVQHALLSILEHYHRGDLSLETIVKKTSHNVADLYQITDRGYIREGYFADLALLDLNKSFDVSSEPILYKCGWSPFSGYTFKSRVEKVFLNGTLAIEDGKKIGEPRGMRLEFNR